MPPSKRPVTKIAPSGRELSAQLTEGERGAMKSATASPADPSRHRGLVGAQRQSPIKHKAPQAPTVSPAAIHLPLGGRNFGFQTAGKGRCPLPNARLPK